MNDTEIAKLTETLRLHKYNRLRDLHKEYGISLAKVRAIKNAIPVRVYGCRNG